MMELFERLKDSANSLMLNTSLISMILYILGYLSIRFHLTALGIGTDLTIVDERYLFTGARFVIFLVSTIPSLILLFILVASVFYLPIFILPKSLKQPLTTWLSKCWIAIKSWWSLHDRLLIAAIILAVFEIQFVMRQSFFISNLLVASDFTRIPEFLRLLMLQENSHLLPLFFMLMTGFWVLSCIFYASNLKNIENTTSTGTLRGVLGFLIVVQFLMLPVNYGTLYVDKSMPKVTNLGSKHEFAVGENAWLVWEGSKSNSYLVWNKAKKTRVLVSIPKSDIKSVSIEAYDPLLSMILQQ